MPTTIEIYEHLKPKLGERETRELLEWIESEKLHLATKEDVELSKNELRKEIEMMGIQLRKEMETMKVDLIKWMFGLWITLVLAILGLYFKK